MSNYFKAFTVLESKDGNEYIKFNNHPKYEIKVVDLDTGEEYKLNNSSASLKQPDESLKTLHEKGFIDETEMLERIEKIPSYVLMEALVKLSSES